ncbi:hypothetical protein [Rothia uropygioeca]|uniref:hypothetical protein n=1 Tax=Kocuria sp. 257 TaxID=2021970 RepID=UPI001EDE6540|nr:hypothetical protein [Kocuria sp. 257]
MLDLLVKHNIDQVETRREMAVQRSGADMGLTRDHNGRSVKPIVGERLACCGHDASAVSTGILASTFSNHESLQSERVDSVILSLC